jgi:hypothetical protein
MAGAWDWDDLLPAHEEVPAHGEGIHYPPWTALHDRLRAMLPAFPGLAMSMAVEN